jgi:Protein of unknown function (DUF3106)
MALAFGVLAWAGIGVHPAHAQAQSPAPLAAPAVTIPAPATKPAPPKAPAVKSVVTRPLWTELNATQQQALKPLASGWNTLSEAQKRKWIALSANYASLPPAEQARLHERAAEWVALSPQQRSEARLNFGQTKALPPAEKQAKWEAYQALSDDEKKKLAAGANSRLPGAATAVKPVPRQKLAVLPPPAKDARPTPRIAAAPHQVDPNTLLPQPGPAPSSDPAQQQLH